MAADEAASQDRRDEEPDVSADVEPGNIPVQDEAKATRKTKPNRPGRRKGALGISPSQQLPVDDKRDTGQSPAEIAVHRGARKSNTALTRPALSSTWYRPMALSVGCCLRPSTPILRPAAPVVMAPASGGPALARRWRCGLDGRNQRVHLAGPTVVALNGAQAWPMRLSRACIQVFLHGWLGLALGEATINRCIHEAGRAVYLVSSRQLQGAVRSSDLLHAGETRWKEPGRLLLLWMFTGTSATLLTVGKRIPSRCMHNRVLGQTCAPWLI